MPAASTESDEKSTYKKWSMLSDKSYTQHKDQLAKDLNLPDLLNKDLKEVEEEHANLCISRSLPH